MPKILIASDHAGFELKGKLVVFLKTLGYEVKDFGAFKFDADDFLEWRGVHVVDNGRHDRYRRNKR